MNLYADMPPRGEREAFIDLLVRPGLRIERIVSHGHASPPGHWYDQARAEWVLVLEGRAGLRFEDEAKRARSSAATSSTSHPIGVTGSNGPIPTSRPSGSRSTMRKADGATGRNRSPRGGCGPILRVTLNDGRCRESAPPHEETTAMPGTTMRKLVGALLCVAALAGGCAHQPGGTRVDVERLLNAVTLDDASYVKSLVASGRLTPDERIPAPVYPDGAPLITLAARDGALDTLRYLVAAGAEIDATTPVGETALMLAAYFPNEQHDTALHERYEKAVRFLLDAGARVESPPYHYTALSYAAYRNRVRIVRQLLAKGARVDGEVAGGITYVNTPLMMAAIQGHYDTALSLLRAGADPTIRSCRGHTAADLAIKYKHAQVASLLRCAQRVASKDALSRCS